MGIHRIPIGKVGIVIRLYGRRREGEFSPHVSVLGSPGPQATVLKSNQTYVLPPGQNRVEYRDQVHVKRGTIGLVVAKEGKPRQDALAPFIECDRFQDGEAFLVQGGQRGIQMQVLPEGDYDINPYLFDVITTDNVDRHADLGLRESDLYAKKINAGETGVVITHAGGPKTTSSSTAAPRVPGHHHFRDPWQFLGNGGQLGVQEETLPSGGHYMINPVFAHVVRVPTREIELEWTKDPKGETNFDASLEQVTLDVEGHTVRLDLTQTLLIPERAAPGLVLRFGDEQARNGLHPVQQFVEKVLANTVTSYFQKISAHEKILDFITKYDEIGSALTQEVDDALSSFGVTPGKTQLGAYTVTPDDINELRRDIANKKHEVKLQEADIEVQRKKNVIAREALDVEAARRRLELIVTQGEVEMFGAEAVLYLRLIDKMAQMGVPDAIVGGDIAEAIRTLPFAQVGELLTHVYGGTPGRRHGLETAVAKDKSDGENRPLTPADRVETRDRRSPMSEMTEQTVLVRHNVEQGQLVMPFYLVCDVSSSMKEAMPVLNDGVRRLRRAIVAEPVVDDLAQVSVMTFSTSASIVMPMGQLSEQEIPELCAGGGTQYGEAFRALAQAIRKDIARLKAEGYKVYRPCAFFLTDGAPSDGDWSRTFTDTLTYDRQTRAGMKGHPIFVPFGFGAAREDVLRQLAYPPDRSKWYQSKTHDVGQALNGILELIMNTVITSTRSAESGKPDILLEAVQDGDIEQGDSGYDPDYV